MAKFQISIDDRLMNLVDDYCKSHYMRRSQFFTIALVWYLKDVEKIPRIIDISSNIVSVSKSGIIQSDLSKKISDFLSDYSGETLKEVI